MLIRSDVDQNLLSKFTNMTSDSRISDQRLRSKRTGSMVLKEVQRRSLKKVVGSRVVKKRNFGPAAIKLSNP